MRRREGEGGIKDDLQVEDWWEGVSELQDANCCYEGSEAEEVGNGSSDDVCKGPIHRHNSCPQNLSRLGSQRRCIKEIDEDVVVQNLDADISIQTGRDQGTDKTHNIPGRLPCIRANSLI